MLLTTDPPLQLLSQGFDVWDLERRWKRNKELGSPGRAEPASALSTGRARAGGGWGFLGFLFFCNLGQLENLMLEGYVGLLLPLAAGAWLLQNRSCECFWDQIGEGR